MQRAGRRPGNAPADPRSGGTRRSRQRDLSALRIIFVQRLGSSEADLVKRAIKASAECSTTCTGRPRSPTRRSRRPRTCAPTPAAPAVREGTTSASTTRRDGGAGRARPAGSSSATGSSRRVHRRREQGDDRRPDVLRGRRPFRRRGTALHRRPRRRDDRLGGENVFPPEVEELLRHQAEIQDVAVIGGRRREVRTAAQGVRRPARGHGAGRGRDQGLRQGEPGELQGPARGRVPRRAAAEPPGKVLKRELASR